MTALEWNAMVLVGRILRPHGNRGQVIVAPETDFVEQRFAPDSVVWIERAKQPAPLTVTECRVHDGRPIIGFAGFDSINDAETLRGCELRVPDEALPTLAPGQFWHHQLIGCRVITADGAEVGSVIRVDDGATALLVVASEGGDVLVPLVDSFCRKIDPEARTIEIVPVPGLLELNTKRVAGAEERKDA